MQISVLERIAEVDRGLWDAVVAASGAPVFYTSDFLAAYERWPLQAGLQPFYLVLRDDRDDRDDRDGRDDRDDREDREGGEGGDGAARPLAVVPAYLQESMDLVGVLGRADPAWAAGGQRGLLSHFWHCYDTRLPGASSRAAVAAVCSTLGTLARQRGAAWYGFINVETGGELAGHLADLGLTPRPIWNRYILDLTAFGSADDYVDSLPRKQRSEMRRQVRRAGDAGAEIAVREPPFANAAQIAEIAEIAALCRRTTAKFGSVPYYPEPAFAELLAAAGRSTRIVTLRLAGALLGTYVCFTDHDRFHTWAAGADYQAASFSPYYVCFYEAVRAAIAAGVPLMECGRGNARFKERYGMQVVPLSALLGRP
ncbi:MAG: GNAT family N-acetyltransferase [Acidobacteriota bacterium]|nr:GNAT family N-acetyltransferase [Acidobacteriota bacterium]